MGLKALKVKIGVFNTGYTVAMVTCNVKKIITTCSPVIGHLLNTITVDPSKLRC